ncbi:MAG: hypothetical protein FJ004_04315 [Chloroflexi bacterium]|nr:hypothetical protein [Chloroflexota bacterium]
MSTNAIKKISVDSPHVLGNKIQFKIHVSKPLRKYFLSDVSYAQYDGIDLNKVDSSIIAIPMLSILIPIAWAAGADVHVAELDASYLQCLEKVKDAYKRYLPGFSFSGSITAGKVTSNRFGGKRNAMLFSGGVDSMTSYLRNRDLKPDFISIWGLPDIPHFEDRFWHRMWADIRSLASLDGLAAFQVKTDMYRNINHELLSREFGVSWFTDASFSLFMLSLCAPVTAVREIGTIIIAASGSEDYKGKSGYGSHPSIDNNISWADTKVLHDAFELTRQQKVEFLCKGQNERYLSHLRVCWDSALETNCGDCEKCIRTIVSLVIEGADPNKCNFRVDDKTFPFIRDCFSKGVISLPEGQLHYWKGMQKRIPAHISNDIYGSRKFLEWLRGFDLSQYRVNKFNKLIWDVRRLLSYKRNTAPSALRKLKAYFYIALDKLKLI